MIIECHQFDRLHSMTNLSKTRSNGQIVLRGQCDDPEMKIMLISSPSGVEITLKSVSEYLNNKVFSVDGQLICDAWCNLTPEISFYFVSMQNTRCVVRSRLCRYTAFSYIIKNGQVELYDCDNNVVTHKSYVDITMPIYYTVETEKTTIKKMFRKPEVVDSDYYRISFDCENEDLYKDGYIQYVCGDVLIPVTLEMVHNGFFIKKHKNEPELITNYRELIDLGRK